MAIFKVLCQQYVEEVCEIEVEAESAEAARQMVLDEDMMVDADWSDGSDSYEAEIYLIKDAKGGTVWDRNIDGSV